VQFQPELPQPFPEFLQEPVSLGPVLKTENIIVSVSDDNDVTLRTLPAPGVHPQVEHVM
jgi:hypothetical protein